MWFSGIAVSLALLSELSPLLHVPWQFKTHGFALGLAMPCLLTYQI
jgi:hypothetical protein